MNPSDDLPCGQAPNRYHSTGIGSVCIFWSSSSRKAGFAIAASLSAGETWLLRTSLALARNKRRWRILFRRKPVDVTGLKFDLFEHFLLLFRQDRRQNLCRPAFRYGSKDQRHLPSRLQLGLKLQSDEIFVLDNQYTGRVVHYVSPGVQNSTGVVR